MSGLIISLIPGGRQTIYRYLVQLGQSGTHLITPCPCIRVQRPILSRGVASFVLLSARLLMMAVSPFPIRLAVIRSCFAVPPSSRELRRDMIFCLGKLAALPAHLV